MSRQRIIGLGLVLVLVLAALLAGCGGSAPTKRSSSGSTRAPEPASGAACVVGLSYSNVAFDREVDTGKPGGCGVATAVRVLASPTDLNRPVTVDCGLASAWAAWDYAVVQPAAQGLFGQAVARVHHYGGYVCRKRTGGSRLSEHAYGKAIDIAAFELADGTMISVKRHWRTGDARETFLRRVTQGACRHFHVVLSPNSNAAHADHLHLDVGPWKLCSP